MRRLTPLALLLIVVAVGVVMSWRQEERARTTPVADEEAALASVEHPAASWSPPMPAEAAVTDPEVLARPSCVADLLAIDRAPGLDGVRAAFARGLPGDDDALFAYLAALVAERIGSDPEAALAVLAWAEDASVEEATVLLEGLAQSAGARDPRVAARLLALGGDTGTDELRRMAALDALGTQTSLDGDGRSRLRALALEGDSGAVAWHSTRALGRVMAESYREGNDIEPYLDELDRIARQHPEGTVRGLALEAPMHADVIVGKDRIDGLVDMMLDEPQRDVRELAVFQLGLTSSPTDALAGLRRAFEQEYDVCVRWAIVRFAVRAGGESALPLLDYFVSLDPTFAEDVATIRALFAAGYQDFEQIWLQLPERHACAVEDGEPHGGAL